MVFLYSCPVLGQGRYSGSREDICLCDESYNCDITNLYFIRTAASGNADEDFYKCPGLDQGGSLYLRVIAVSYLLTGISQMYLCILKNSGRAAKSSMISATSVVINIFINAVLIYGLFGMPRMEIAGAALATVTARIIEVMWCVLKPEEKIG